METQKEVPLSGDLKEIPFPEIMHSLYIRKRTGVLRLENDRINKEIFFRDGYPVFVRSNILNETLGRLLLKQGKISQEVYETTLKKMAIGKKKQGSILLEMGHLTPQELYDAIQFQVKYRIFDCFGWDQGKYNFTERNDFFEEITIYEFNPAWIINQGIQQKFNQKRLQEIMKSQLNKYLVKSPDPPYRLQDMGIGPAELQLVSLVNGSRTLRDVVAASKMEHSRKVQILYALLTTEMIISRSQAETVERVETPPAPSQVEKPPAPRQVEKPQVPRQVEKPPVTKKEEQVAKKKPPKKELTEEKKKLQDELVRRYLKIKEMNYFEILGVKQEASKDEIRKVYFRLAKKYHPDKYFDAADSEIRKTTEEIFRIISRAYDVLSHDEERAKYEKFLRTGKTEEETSREVDKIVNAEIQFQKGEVLLRKKDYDGALGAFKQAIDLNPKEGEYYVYLGWTMFKKTPPGQKLGVNEAEEYIMKGLSMNPRIHDAYIFLGNIFKLDGRETEAENQFKKALEYNPNSTEALRELRLINMRREKSKGVFKKIFK
ncbi:MAG: DnaJ domain-containing protein [Deltaproteobacteria bacterium]|nr:MAG: DnaJ domain-containing protein [Deltaproteobacteria bacterium]